MSNMLFNKVPIKELYERFSPKYKQLANNLKHDLERLLNQAKIDCFDIDYRKNSCIKEFESFWEKIERKGYRKPFHETKDICGLRIICYYTKDLEKIKKIIKKEFDVKEFEDKAKLLEPDQFGYRSWKFIVTVKNSWLKAPNYRDLKEIKAEIQVLTILMDAWANLEYKLGYKQPVDIPKQFKRRLSRLSALIEEADERFEDLRKEREKYIKQITEKTKKIGHFDIRRPMNLDTLQAFLDFYFPDRSKNTTFTSQILDAIIKNNLSFEILIKYYEEVHNLLPNYEAECFGDTETKLSQTGILAVILFLKSDKYWDEYHKILPPDFMRLLLKYKTQAKLVGKN